MGRSLAAVQHPAKNCTGAESAGLLPSSIEIAVSRGHELPVWAIPRRSGSASELVPLALRIEGAPRS